MRRMKDFGVFIAITLICVCIVGGSVSAKDGEYNRRSRIASKGAVKYSNNTVVLNSSDLIYLADEIDQLEREYKSATMEALNRIGTFYVSADGDISHDDHDNNVSSDAAAELSFSDLYQGILESQSVEHLADVQAEDADGSPLYYADRNACESHDITSTTTDANDYPVLIQPAAAGNLTAGTAAWVDGELIIGSGTDNTAYYDNGRSIGRDWKATLRVRFDVVETEDEGGGTRAWMEAYLYVTCAGNKLTQEIQFIDGSNTLWLRTDDKQKIYGAWSENGIAGMSIVSISFTYLN